jgi:thioredoxin 1
MKEISKEEFEVLKGRDYLILDFYADWCMPCSLLKPILEKIEKDMNIEIFKINVDKNPDLASNFGIMSIPTLIFLKGGKEKDRLVGLVPEAFVKEWIKKNLK